MSRHDKFIGFLSLHYLLLYFTALFVDSVLSTYSAVLYADSVLSTYSAVLYADSVLSTYSVICRQCAVYIQCCM